MSDVISEVVGDVKMESSSQVNIEQLQATADGENRNLALEGTGQQCDLGPISLKIYPLRRRRGERVVMIIHVVTRIDIAAPCQDQSVEHVGPRFGVILAGGEQGYLASSPPHRSDVAFGKGVSIVAYGGIDGNPDQWSIHVRFKFFQSSVFDPRTDLQYLQRHVQW